MLDSKTLTIINSQLKIGKKNIPWCNIEFTLYAVWQNRSMSACNKLTKHFLIINSPKHNTTLDLRFLRYCGIITI